MKIRLVVCDVDGTLVRHDKDITRCQRRSDEAAEGRRRRDDADSARPMSGILWLADALALDGPFGAFNGGTLFDARGAVIGEPERLAPEVARRIFSILDEAQVDVWLFAHERWHARDDRNRHVPSEKLSAALEPTIRSDLENLCDAADKIVGVSDDAALLRRLVLAADFARHGEEVQDADRARSDWVHVDLVMKVNPGFGDQVFRPDLLPKIAALRARCNERGLALHIEVDGGQGPESVHRTVDAGGDVIVAGSAIFGALNYGEAIARMRAAAR